MVDPLLDRVLAAARAARHVDETLERHTGLEGYEDAKYRLARERLSAQLWWATVLADLVPVVPSGRRAAVLDDAVSAAREIADSADRAVALARLTPHMPPDLQGELADDALALARALEDEDARAAALAELVVHLPESETLVAVALDAVRGSMDYGVRGRWYAVLARHAPAWLAEALQELAIDMIPRVEGWETELSDDAAPPLGGALEKAGEDLCTAVIAVMRHLPGEVARPLLPDGLRIARAPRRTPSQSAAVMAELARHQPDELFAEALAAAQRVDDREQRAGMLATLADPLARLAPARQLEAWSEVLAGSARRVRADLLADIRALAPALAALAGPPGGTEAASAIEDAGRWWP
jgi:hypothetical protein